MAVTTKQAAANIKAKLPPLKAAIEQAIKRSNVNLKLPVPPGVEAQAVALLEKLGGSALEAMDQYKAFEAAINKYAAAAK